MSTQSKIHKLTLKTTYRQLIYFIGGILVLEFSTMLVMVFLPPLPLLVSALIDCIILSILIAPSVYFLVIRPERKHQLELKRNKEALDESEKNLADIYASMTEGLAIHEIIFDATGKAVDYVLIGANPAYEKLINKRLSDVVGTKFTERYSLEKALFIDVYSQVATTGEPAIFETYFAPLNKHLSISGFSPGKGTVATFIRDITEIKQAENALKQLNEELEDRVKERTFDLVKSNEVLRITEEKYRTVSDFATNWEFWIDSNDRMLYCSPSCERNSGYTANEFVQNPQLIFDIIHPEDLPDFKEHNENEKTAHVCDHEIQYRIIRKDGAVRWMGHFCQPVFDASGKFRGIRGSNQDITARKKTEEMLTTSNQKYKLLSENITDGIFVCKNGCFEYVNMAIYAIFGYPEKELEGMKLTQLIGSENNQNLETILYSKETANQSYEMETICLKKDHSIIYVELLLNYISKDKLVYGVIHDITEKKDIQKNIVKAIIQTEEKERAYFSKELHEGLGPLLSTIKLYLQWSERLNNNTSRTEIIDNAEEILEEAILTVKEISGKLSPHLLTNYGLSSAIRNFVDKLNVSATCNIIFESNSTRRINVEIEASLYRAIIECINNSIKYAEAANIHILLEDSGNQIQLQYKDDGIGFDIQEALAQQKGLGLFNLQNRLNTIGGAVDLISEPGKGVDYQFTVNI